jgi:ketosteroid isomerase-like protein
VAPVAEEAILFDLPPPLQYGGDPQRLARGLQDWFATWDGPVTVEMAEPTVLVDGNLAVVFALSRMYGIKTDGEPVDSWNRRTVVLRRFDESWKIVHEHSSYPLEMDGSGRAATDLKP